MNEWALPTIALLLIGYGAVSARLRTTMVSQAMVFTAAGLLVASWALDLVDIDAANQFVRHLAEATLALVLFTDAVRVNLGRLRRESLVPARLLGVGLPLTIVAGTLGGLALFPPLDLWTAAALATMLAPTDAALGLPVVSNRRLPSRIRQGLNVESGLNDGVCVPLLIIFLTVAQAEEGVGELEPLRVILEEIGFGAAGGVIASVLAAWVLRSFRPRGWMEETWQQINAVATPLLAYTVAVALGGSCSTPPPSCCSGRCCSARRWVSWTGGSPCTRRSASPWYACSRWRWRCSAPACVGSPSASSAGSGPAAWPRSCSS
jgi:sodium/hydrogen antiporter